MSTINAEKLAWLRKRARKTVDELAEAAKVGRATITRIENGRTRSSNPVTVTRLAEALNCREAELFTAPSDEDEKAQMAAREPVDFEMSTQAQNALHLVAMRYDESLDTIVELAPLLFDLFARESLKERSRRLAELESHRRAIAALAADCSHIGERLFNDWDADEIERREEASIRANDLRASYIMKLGGAEDCFFPDDYDDDSMNPFVAFLKQRLEAVRGHGADTPSIDSLSRWGRADYNIGLREALQITGGDELLADLILWGFIPLARMPKALRAADAHNVRLAWLREQAAVHSAEVASLFSDLNIEVNI